MSRLRTAAVVLVLALLGGGRWYVLADPRTAEPAGSDHVLVADGGFDLPSIAVAAGTTATWTFDDDIAHDVSGDGWASQPALQGTFRHTFTEPGVHDYVCTIHPVFMRGRVTVS